MYDSASHSKHKFLILLWNTNTKRLHYPEVIRNKASNVSHQRQTTSSTLEHISANNSANFSDTEQCIYTKSIRTKRGIRKTTTFAKISATTRELLVMAYFERINFANNVNEKSKRFWPTPEAFDSFRLIGAVINFRRCSISISESRRSALLWCRLGKWEVLFWFESIFFFFLVWWNF